MSDPVTFPSGIKALADYVHSKGLRFGVYSDAGYESRISPAVSPADILSWAATMPSRGVAVRVSFLPQTASDVIVWELMCP